MTTHHEPPPPAPTRHPHVLTEPEYQAKKADLEGQLAALAAAHVPPVDAYPRWLYHATEQPQVVASAAAAEALGAGWQETPVAPPAKKSTP